MHVLLVEDDEDIRTMFAEQLTLAGFEVTIACDGLEAVAKVSTESPDIILLDIILPELDGLEVLRKIKADTKTSKIPVVMLSNLNQDNQKSEAEKLGAAAFYVKSSLTPSQMIKTLNEVVDNQT